MKTASCAPAPTFPQQIGPDIDRTGLSLADWAMTNRKPVGRSGRGGKIVGRRSEVGPRGADVLYITLDAILARIAERVVTVYGAQGCRVLVRGRGRGAAHRRVTFPSRSVRTIDRTGLSLAEWAMTNRNPVGRSGRGGRIVGRNPVTPASPRGADVLYLPIMTKDRVAGVLEVTGRPGSAAFRAESEQPLTTFVDQAALALERARLSEEAAQAAALAQSDELKSALLAAVSHDLRTPLASIKASATSLLDDSVDWDAETRRDFLTAIDEETDRLTLMVSNLLDLSRIEGGALRPQMDWYDVDELIADVRSRMAARAAGHPLTVTVEPDLPPLRFDYVEIAQVLVNLIENAVKYTPAGTPIAVSARMVPGAVEIAVHDDGPGIPPESQRRLFEKFYRARSGTSAPGSGIGLSISKGLVEAHGGTISVESAPGAGTTFRFTLPLVTETVGTQRDGNMSGERVLVIDDEPQIRRALRTALDAHGYAVEVAADGAAGLEAIATWAPDAIVLDLVMPGIDGFEVLRQTRTWSRRAGDRPLRTGPGAGQGGGARPGRRRLLDEAVWHGRVPGPLARCLAPRARPGAAQPARRRRHDRPGAAAGLPRRSGGPPDANRVRSAARPGE